MKHRQLSFLTTVGLAALLCGPSLALAAAVLPDLGTTSPFGIVSSTFTNSNTGLQTAVTGSVCWDDTGPTTPPVSVSGSSGSCAAQIGLDQGTALTTLITQPCTPIGTTVALNAYTVGANPPGTFPPGCYSSSGAMNITANTTVTLSGNGVYVFRPGGALNTFADSSVVLSGACADHVFWAPVGATTLGANSTFVGTIIDNAGISIGHFATLTGRALDFATTVTTDANTITVPQACQAPPNPIAPSISKAFNPTAIGVDGVSRLTITLTNPDPSIATLITAFVDTLPPGVVIADTPNASTNCLGTGAVVAVAGGTTVTLPSTRAIPASGSCTVAVNVTASAVGSYLNIIPSGALETTNGDNAAPAEAPLVVDESVPTLPGWAMIMLAALLALAGFTAMRRREA